MMMSLEELIASGKTSAVKTFREYGRLTAVLFIHDAISDGIKPFCFQSDDDKQEYRTKLTIVSLVGQLRRMGRFGGAFLQSEAWLAEEHDIPKGKRPEHAPNRREQILLNAYDSVGNKRMVTSDIRRAGGIVELGPWVVFEGKFEGWFDKAFTDAEKILASK